MKLRVHDTVAVIAGKDLGKQGKITKIYPKTQKVVVEGINMYKRHMKRQSDQQPGGIVSVERPMDVSKVQLVCPSCKAVTRVGMDVSKGAKERICKKCGKPVAAKKS